MKSFLDVAATVFPMLMRFKTSFSRGVRGSRKEGDMPTSRWTEDESSGTVSLEGVSNSFGSGAFLVAVLLKGVLISPESPASSERLVEMHGLLSCWKGL